MCPWYSYRQKGPVICIAAQSAFCPLKLTVIDSRDRIFNDLAGGFYSDTEAFVGDTCRKCPNGTFVHYSKSPGVSASDCTACPQGINVKQRKIRRGSFG